MTFLGMSMKEEMEIFSVINGKAKGLSSSLLDFHETRLTEDLSSTKPELFLALRLAEDPRSPWYQRLDLGGAPTVGMHRYASLRTMQKAAKRFLRAIRSAPATPRITELPNVLVHFWLAVARVLHKEWREPRKYLLTKGIGVYSLMSLAGELVHEGLERGVVLDQRYFEATLSDFLTAIDWSSNGPLRGFGGVSGADQALQVLHHERSLARQFATHD
jgi:DGQHR domain-containing protein